MKRTPPFPAPSRGPTSAFNSPFGLGLEVNFRIFESSPKSISKSFRRLRAHAFATLYAEQEANHG